MTAKREVVATEQVGASPKLLYGALTAVIAYVLTKYGLKVDPDLAAAIALGLGGANGAIVKPGRVRAA